MSWTKEQFILQAYEELGYASYNFDLMPEQKTSALKKLDAMMAGWNALGVRIGYPLPNKPEDSSLTADTGVPDAANEAIYLNLAIRIAPSIGKNVAIETKMLAESAYRILVNTTSEPVLQMQLPSTMPLGAGAKPWRRSAQFVTPPTQGVDAGADSEIILQ